MRERLSHFFTIVYIRIFADEPPATALKFAGNIGYFGVAYGIAAVFSFSFQVVAGRFLEPSSYGEYAIIDSAASILSILMLIGITAGMVRLNAAATDKGTRASVMSSAIFLTLIFSLFFAVVFFFFSPQLARLLVASNKTVLVAIIYGVVHVLYTLATGCLQSLLKIKSMAVFQVVYSLCLLVCLVLLVYFGVRRVNPAVVATILASGLVTAAIMFTLRGYISARAVSPFWIGRLARYAVYGTMGVAAGSLLANVDKLLINRFLATADVGIYRAYLGASVGLVSMAVTVFGTVFFPTASRHPDKKAILHKINRLLPYAIVLGLPAVVCVEFVILKMYGTQYPFDWRLALLFAIASIIFGLYNVYAYLVSAHGLKGARITAFIMLGMALVDIALNVTLIPSYRLFGAISATAIAYLGALGVLLYHLSRGIEVEL